MFLINTNEEMSGKLQNVNTERISKMFNNDILNLFSFNMHSIQQTPFLGLCLDTHSTKGKTVVLVKY